MVLGDEPDTQSRRIRLLVGFILGFVLVIFLIVPLEALPLPVCLFKEVTGVSCLTCGLTRSLHAAGRGDIVGALRFHLLGPFLIAGVAVIAAVCVAGGFARRPMGIFGAGRLPKAAVLTLVSVWMMYGVARAIAELGQ